MRIDDDHKEMLTVLLAATERRREATPARPDGLAKWHTANLLRQEGLHFMTETDVDRTGYALQRRGMVSHTTRFGVTRWALTGHGTGQARHLLKSVTS